MWKRDSMTGSPPKPHILDPLWFVTDQGIYTSRLLDQRGTLLYCQAIPAYVRTGCALSLLFPHGDVLWTLPITMRAAIPSQDVISVSPCGPASLKDARQHERHAVAVPVRCQAPDREVFDTVSSDFSVGGVRFFSPHALLPGTRLVVQLQLSLSVITLPAYTIWSLAQGDAVSSRREEIAAMFVNVAQPDREFIHHWLVEHCALVQM